MADQLLSQVERSISHGQNSRIELGVVYILQFELYVV